MASETILEIACFNLESTLIAESNGADRIELCENYPEGGITPSFEMIREVKEKSKIPIHVIIRPRGGDFVYTASEFQTMKEQILFCKAQRIDGVVFGVLNRTKMIDLEANRTLKELAFPLSVTFHRAIDQCADINKAFQNLVDLKIDRVLSSGGKTSAIKGIDTLAALQKEFGSRIGIIPGGGIRSTNLESFAETDFKEFHSAAITGSDILTDPREVQALKAILSRK